MSLSAAGVVVCIALIAIGRMAGSAIVVPIFASIAFGCTAIVSLPAVGTPLISTIFELALVGSAILARDFLKGLGLALREHVSARIACLLAFFAIVSAVIMPRLFAGDVTVNITLDGLVTEAPIAPGNNVNQTAYLLVGIVTFLCMLVLLYNIKNVRLIRKGIFYFVTCNVLFGIIDLGGKFTGSGDWLLPIRTADYAMLVDTESVGFWRIAGGCSEASSYAIQCLACVSFTFTYWRWTGSKLAFILAFLLLLLLAFSTSTTAYLGLCALAAFVGISLVFRTLSGRAEVQDFTLLLILLTAFVVALALYLYNEHIYDSFSDLIEASIFNKANTDSGQERSYWNQVAIQNFIDTYGLGTGMGSSRSSSWAVSVLSQLGVSGTLLFVGLLAALVNGAGAVRVAGKLDLYALISSTRAMGIGWLLGSCIAGSSADPGLLFFLCLSVVLACKHHLKRAARTSCPMPAHGAGFQRFHGSLSRFTQRTSEMKEC